MFARLRVARIQRSWNSATVTDVSLFFFFFVVFADSSGDFSSFSFSSLCFILTSLSLSVRFYSKQNFPSFLNRQRSYHEFPAGKINIVRLRKNFIFLRCLLFFSSPSHTYLQPQKSSAPSLRLFHPPVAPWPASSGCSIYFHRNTREQSRKRRFFFHFFTPSGTTDRKFYPR